MIVSTMGGTWGPLDCAYTQELGLKVALDVLPNYASVGGVNRHVATTPQGCAVVMRSSVTGGGQALWPPLSGLTRCSKTFGQRLHLHQPPCSAVSAAISTSASGLLAQRPSSSWCTELSAKLGLDRENPTFLQWGRGQRGEVKDRRKRQAMTQQASCYERLCGRTSVHSVLVTDSEIAPSSFSPSASLQLREENGAAHFLLNETTGGESESASLQHL